MEKDSFSIPNISCGHCVMSIQKELGGIEGVSKVEGDPLKKEIVVEYDAPAGLEEILTTLREINYPVAE